MERPESPTPRSFAVPAGIPNERQHPGSTNSQSNDHDRAQSRPASLRDPNGGFQRKPKLTSTMLNVLSWSAGASRASLLIGLQSVFQTANLAIGE